MASIKKALLLTCVFLGAQTMAADFENRCVIPSACFKVTTRFEPLIAEKVALFRSRAKAARAAGKYIGYISIPLSTRAGRYFALNADVALRVEKRLLEQFGADAVWILNPASADASMFLNGENASQSDYMYMWAQVLAGESLSGDDIDFVYFAGVADFAEYLGLPSTGQLNKLAERFEQLMKTDKKFADAVSAGKIKKAEFVSYYGFRVGAEASAGSHDEWNLIDAINEKRRKDDPKEGIAHQIPIFFNGYAVPPADSETPVAPGNALPRR